MIKKRCKFLVCDGCEAYVVRRDGRVRIKMLRGIVSRKSGIRVISRESMQGKMTILFYKKEVVSVGIRLSSEEDTRGVFEGDLLLVWIEDGSPVMNCLIVHSQDECMRSLTSHFKITDSPEMLELLKAYLGPAVKMVNAEFSSYDFEKALPMHTVVNKEH